MGDGGFLRKTKFDGERIIDRADMHYREHPTWDVRDLMAELGYQIGGMKYERTGISSAQSLGKRFLKRLLVVAGLAEARFLAAGDVIWASKPAWPGQIPTPAHP